MESQQKIELSKATKREKDSLEIIVRWLSLFNRMSYPQTQNRKTLTEEDFAIYAAALADLPPEVIEAACEKYMKIGKFFPLPADLREMVVVAEDSAHTLAVNEAWNGALAWTRKWYLGIDMGFDRRAPELDEKQHRAIVAAGGFEHVSSCTLEDLQWAKKRFVENYGHQEIVEQSGALLGRGEAKKILDRLRAPAREVSSPRFER